jgi:hypothetical protein
LRRLLPSTFAAEVLLKINQRANGGLLVGGHRAGLTAKKAFNVPHVFAPRPSFA